MNFRTKPIFQCLLSIFLLISLVFIISCPPPNDGNGNGGGDGDGDGNGDNGDKLEPPSAVSAWRDGSQIIVQWSKVNKADNYQVFRKAGNGGFTNIAGAFTSASQWNDETYPSNSTFCYAIKSEADGEFSALSASSNILSARVQNVDVTRLAYTNKIRLTWDVHPEELDEYIVFRYISRDEDDPDNPDASFDGIDINYFDDEYDATTDKPAEDTPYFYRVTWIDNEEEFGQDAPLVFGIYSYRIDENEPDDTADEAEALELNLAPITSCIYSFGDGDGGTEVDEDWYYYQCPPGQGFYVKINITDDAEDSKDFINGELFFRFYYDDAYLDENSVNIAIENSFGFTEFLDATTDIYFTLYTSVPAAKDVIDDYTISVSDEN